MLVRGIHLLSFCVIYTLPEATSSDCV